MSSERDRVISINLTESEWQAFVACQPRPVDWLRARILEAVAAASSLGSRGQPPARLVPDARTARGPSES